MFWVFVCLFLVVIGAKYYTAIGSRNLERRLNRVKDALEDARQRLRKERQRQSDVANEEEMAELRVRYMKELMMDLQVRLSQSDGVSGHREEARDRVAAIMQF